VCAGAGALAWAWLADRAWFELHVGVDFCAWDPAQLRRWTAWRIAGAVVGLLLILVVRRVVGRWTAKAGGASVLRLVASVVGATALALVVSDLVLRPRPPEPSPLLPPVYPNPRYGWGYERRSTTTIHTGDRDIVYAFDDRGDRARSADAPTDPRAPTLLIAGESIADGIGLPWDETFAGVLERRTRLQVVNSSVWGWDMGRVYARTQDELRDLAQPLAVVTVIITQQVERNEEIVHPRFVLGADGSLSEIPTASPWWIGSPVRKLAHEILVLHDAEPLRVGRAVLVATDRDVRARGAYPLFVLTNWGSTCLPDAPGPPSIEGRLFDGLDLQHIRVDLDPAGVDGVTHHPDVRLHALLADAIELALRDAHVLAAPAP
jgi:hypothetical protein